MDKNDVTKDELNTTENKQFKELVGKCRELDKNQSAFGFVGEYGVSVRNRGKDDLSVSIYLNGEKVLDESMTLKTLKAETARFINKNRDIQDLIRFVNEEGKIKNEKTPERERKPEQKKKENQVLDKMVALDCNSAQLAIDVDGDGIVDYNQIYSVDDEIITDVRDCDPTMPFKKALDDIMRDANEKAMEIEKNRVNTEITTDIESGDGFGERMRA